MYTQKVQAKIREDLAVQPTIVPEEEIRKRIAFLKDYIRFAGAKGYILGLSGGQDSTLCGKLVQLAIDECNQEAGEKLFSFIAVRLPYGVQQDEQDAQDAIHFIQPDRVVTINIQPAVDAAVAEFNRATEDTMRDFIKGNVKARERMKAQYDLAGQYGMLVVGTDHAAEAISGFFTKHGDGACDIIPIYGLNKRQGKQLLQALDCPAHLYLKKPTADLEDLRPGLPDEDALGVTYDQIDDFLEGKEIAPQAAEIIIRRYVATEHKRRPAVALHDTWWKR